MRNLFRVGILAAGLCSILPAHAGSWSVQGGYQNLDLDAGDSVAPARHGEFLGASYWVTPDLAVDLVVATAKGIPDSFTLMHTRRFDSLGIGGRKAWELSPQWTLDASAGVDFLRVDRELVRFDRIPDSPNGDFNVSTVTYFDHRRHDLASYVGLGVGWHPDRDWTLRLDARRSWTGVGVTCQDSPAALVCGDDASARLFALRFGAEYRFH